MDYAQARLQARFGERPDESAWRKLDAAREPAAALEIARSSGLAQWVAGIDADANRHAMEIALRTCWRECISEISSWMPRSWQPAMRWTLWLVDLPALCYLARGEPPLPWMLRDPVLQVYARAAPQARETMLRKDCCVFLGAMWKVSVGPVTPTSPPLSHIRGAWLDEWRRRWPQPGDAELLDDLARLLDAATRQPASPMARSDLLRELRHLFRRSVLRPAAAFTYLAIAALDVERLRARLLIDALVREGIVAS